MCIHMFASCDTRITHIQNYNIQSVLCRSGLIIVTIVIKYHLGLWPRISGWMNIASVFSICEMIVYLDRWLLNFILFLLTTLLLKKVKSLLLIMVYFLSNKVFVSKLYQLSYTVINRGAIISNIVEDPVYHWLTSLSCRTKYIILSSHNL